MPTFLLSNWRPLAILLAVIAVFSGGMYFQSLRDERASAKAYEQQVAANQKAQAEANARAAKAEIELAAARQQAINLSDQWERERYAKGHTVCTLSDSTVRLLQSASQ